MSQSSSAFTLDGIFAGFEAPGALPHWALKSDPVSSRLKIETFKNPAPEGELNLINAMQLDPGSIKRIWYRFYQACWEFACKRNIVSVPQFVSQMPLKQTYANDSSRMSTVLHHVPTRNHAYQLLSNMFQPETYQAGWEFSRKHQFPSRDRIMGKSTPRSLLVFKSSVCVYYPMAIRVHPCRKAQWF